MEIENKSWTLYTVQFCPSEVQGNTTTGGMRCRYTLHGGLSECRVYQSTYAGMVTLGVTEEKMGSRLKVNSTPVPVTLALPMCTTTEPVEGRSELL